MMQARLVIIEGNSSEGIVSVTEILYRSSRLKLEHLQNFHARTPFAPIKYQYSESRITGGLP
jgi:hypothetical protein